MPGGTATYLLNLSPSGGTAFADAVTLTASGLPAGATYTLSPSTLAAGSTGSDVTLSIQLPQQTAAVRHGPRASGGLMAIALAMLIFPFSRRIRRSTRGIGRVVSLSLALLAGAGVMTSLTGCGHSSGSSGQNAQSYTVTITAASGALSRTTTVTLIVQ